jgi:GABA(A) receptor-associated protein
MGLSFKDKFNFEQRKQECKRVRDKYPSRIPIIVEINDKNLNSLDKQKFLSPADLSVGQFQYVIRQRIKIKPERALFMFINKNIIPNTSSTLDVLYRQYMDKDGFLYVYVSSENTFG